MTRIDLLDRWLRRAEDLERFDALVDGAKLVRELAAEIELLFRAEEREILTLAEAAAATGFTADHIGRLVRSGKLANLGDKHRPRVRRGDLPRKSGHFAPGPGVVDIPLSKRQIARSVGRRDDG